MAKKRPLPKLIVVFDTNAIITKVPSRLIQAPVCEVISENSTHPDLDVQWYLPEVVVGERRFQMNQKALELLPSIQKMETLLGHKFTVTKDNIPPKVDDAINNDLESMGVSVLSFNAKKADWDDIIERSVKRLPPFEITPKKEKGFRDAIIAESFLQIVERSHKTPSVRHMVIVTNDGPLGEYICEKTQRRKKVRVKSNASELKELINTLLSDMTEENIAALSSKARRIISKKGADTSFNSKDTIRSYISNEFQKELNEKPFFSRTRVNNTWETQNTIFVKRKGGRIHWSTTVIVKAELFGSTYQEIDTNLTPRVQPPDLFSGIRSVTGSSLLNQNIPGDPVLIDPPAIQQSALFSHPDITTSTRGVSGLGFISGLNTLSQIDTSVTKVGSGQSIFVVKWSTRVTPRNKISHPKFDDIEFVRNDWDIEFIPV